MSVSVASAVPVDGPPGIPPAAASQMDMAQLVQLMHAQQQQMATMLHHLVNKQNTVHQPDVGTLVGAHKGLDERHFRRLEKFDNKSESWKEWRTHFLTAVRESSPVTAEVMEKAEVEEAPITGRQSQTGESGLRRSSGSTIFASLASCVPHHGCFLRRGGIVGHLRIGSLETAFSKIQPSYPLEVRAASPQDRQLPHREDRQRPHRTGPVGRHGRSTCQGPQGSAD